MKTLSPIEQAKSDLMLLSQQDYESAGHAEEEIVSGIEVDSGRDLTDEEYQTIGELVEEWYGEEDQEEECEDED